MPKVGKAFNVKETSGNKNGRDWYRTSFGLAIPFVTKDGEAKEEKIFYDLWEKSTMKDGDIVSVEGVFKNEKKRDGEGFEWKLTATSVTVLFSGDGAIKGGISADDDIPF